MVYWCRGACCAPWRAYPKGLCPSGLPTLAGTGAAGEGAQQSLHLGLEVHSVKGSLRRHPRPVPFHGLRPPVSPLTLVYLLSAEIVLF